MIEQTLKSSQPQTPLKTIPVIKSHENQEPKQQAKQAKQIADNEQEEQSSCQYSQAQSAPLSCLICFLCQDTILSAVQCICGHAFCQQCLNTYLSKHRECPICNSKIRGKKGSGNKRLDQFIQDFCSFVGGGLSDNLKQRKADRKHRLERQRLENMYPGMNVDVRDENYIWCRGRIVRTLNKISEQGMRIKYLVVEYEKNDKREEFVYSSSRIAKGGFFTNNVLGQEIEKYRGDEIGNVEELGNPVKKIKRLMEIGKKVEEEDEYNQS